MFKKAVGAKLEGFWGPFFPKNIDELCELNKTVIEVADELLSASEKKRYNLSLMWAVRTSDKFEWHRNPLLEINGVKIAVLFPFSKENRSVAFYTSDYVSKEGLEEILEIFIQAFKRKRTKNYYVAFYHGRYLKFQATDKLPECHYCKKDLAEVEFFNNEQTGEFVHQSCLFNILGTDKDYWVRDRNGRRQTSSIYIPGVTW